MRAWADGLSLFCIEYGCSRDSRFVALGDSVFCKALNLSGGPVGQFGGFYQAGRRRFDPVARSKLINH